MHYYKSATTDHLQSVNFLPDKTLTKITDLINSYLSNLNLTKGYLLHGDISLEHIYKVSGDTYFIDFENCTSGDPLFDIAIFDFYNNYKYPTKNYTDLFLKGYNSQVNYKTITLYKLINAIKKSSDRIKSNRLNTIHKVKRLIVKYFYELS